MSKAPPPPHPTPLHLPCTRGTHAHRAAAACHCALSPPPTHACTRPHARSYLDDYEAALYGPRSADPNLGFRAYVNQTSMARGRARPGGLRTRASLRRAPTHHPPTRPPAQHHHLNDSAPTTATAATTTSNT